MWKPVSYRCGKLRVGIAQVEHDHVGSTSEWMQTDCSHSIVIIIINKAFYVWDTCGKWLEAEGRRPASRKDAGVDLVPQSSAPEESNSPGEKTRVSFYPSFMEFRTNSSKNQLLKLRFLSSSCTCFLLHCVSTDVLCHYVGRHVYAR